MSQDSFESHLSELKSRLTHCIVVLVVLTGTSFFLSSKLLNLIQNDLAVSLHALAAYEVLYSQLLISVIFGFFLALPAVLYQALKFVKPGLHEKEYQLLRNYLPLSIVLFVGGALFAYEFIVKSSLAFFASTTTGTGVEAMWGLQNTIGFALKLSAFTGVTFQLPIASVVLSQAGVLKSESMRKYRAHFFVTVLLFSAIATPPDVVSQVLLTVPVMILYQLSIYLVFQVE